MIRTIRKKGHIHFPFEINASSRPPSLSLAMPTRTVFLKENGPKPSPSFHSTPSDHYDGYAFASLTQPEYRAQKLRNQQRTNLLLGLILFVMVLNLVTTILWSVFVSQKAGALNDAAVDAEVAILTAQQMMNEFNQTRTIFNVGWLVADFVANEYPSFTNMINTTFTVLDDWVAHNNSALLGQLLSDAQSLFTDTEAISSLIQQAVASRVAQKVALPTP